MKKGKSYSYVNIQINTNAHESEVVITLEIYRKRVLFGQEPLESFLKVNLFFVSG